jgi:hypothetical protein
VDASRGRAVNQAACRQRFGSRADASLGPRGSNDGIVAQLTRVECCDFVAGVSSGRELLRLRWVQWVMLCLACLLFGYLAGWVFGWLVW